VQRREVAVTEAHAVHRTRLEVLADDVEARHEALHQLASLGMLEVDRDALLVEVVTQVGRADAAAVDVLDRGQRAAARVARLRVLDLHHLGAEPREQLRRERQRLHLLDREDAYAREGAGALGRIGHVLLV
jgi:hypothetical protein